MATTVERTNYVQKMHDICHFCHVDDPKAKFVYCLGCKERVVHFGKCRQLYNLLQRIREDSLF